MSPLLLAGWLSAVGSAALLLLARRTARRSTEHVVRACHELRGPLQNVMLALGASESEGSTVAPSAAPRGTGTPVGSTGPGRRPPLAALAVELTRASRAVDDLAAVVTGRRAGEEHRRIELGPLVRDLVAVHDLAARTRGRRVELDGLDAPASVIGDRARLTQAISNLVANAVEHGEGTVRVGIAHGPGRVDVVVTDEGHGLRVPIDDLLRTRRRGQRGRGMRIVADALAAHGGRLRSSSTVSGARIVAELPVAGRLAAADPPAADPRAAARPATVAPRAIPGPPAAAPCVAGGLSAATPGMVAP